MDQMCERPENRILDLYEELKGVEFQGRYLGVKDKSTRDGVPVSMHLVEVVSDHMKNKMDAISGCDRDDEVWKGIDGNRFWVSSITGQSSGEETNTDSITVYELVKVKHHTQLLKWQKKDYSSVIDIYLKVVPRN